MPRAPLLALAAVVALAAPALAHEHVMVGDGKYELTVGWRSEPAYVGEPNGLDLKVARVAEHAEGDGHSADAHAASDVVLNAEDNLTITYEYGGKTFSPPNLRASFGRPGWYTAEITPTRPGVYTVHIRGTIEGTPVDVKVEPHEVAALDEVSFPEVDDAPYETAEAVAALEARVDVLEAEDRAMIDDTPEIRDVDGTPAPGVLLVGAGLLVVALLAPRRGG